MLLELAGLLLLQIRTHLSKYWSDGGSSSLSEMVKWHACLWEEKHRGGVGGGNRLLLTVVWQVSPHCGAPHPPLPPLEPKEGECDLNDPMT